MRAVIQRVISASVTISGNVKAEIGRGLMVLIGIENEDKVEDIQWLSNKIANMRIFNDANEIMNLSVREVEGEVLIISQFTLHASTKKGSRPSYIKAAKPDFAIPVYEKFKLQMKQDLGGRIKSGEFGADMKVELINDGPVTIIVDTKSKE